MFLPHSHWPLSSESDDSTTSTALQAFLGFHFLACLSIASFSNCSFTGVSVHVSAFPHLRAIPHILGGDDGYGRGSCGVISDVSVCEDIPLVDGVDGTSAVDGGGRPVAEAGKKSTSMKIYLSIG